MTHQSYLNPLAKTSVRNSPAHWKLPIFGSPPLEISVALRGEAGGGYGYFLELHTKNSNNNNKTYTHKKKCKNNKVKQ